jgi:hypothetical protein
MPSPLAVPPAPSMACSFGIARLRPYRGHLGVGDPVGGPASASGQRRRSRFCAERENVS